MREPIGPLDGEHAVPDAGLFEAEILGASRPEPVEIGVKQPQPSAAVLVQQGERRARDLVGVDAGPRASPAPRGGLAPERPEESRRRPQPTGQRLRPGARCRPAARDGRRHVLSLPPASPGVAVNCRAPARCGAGSPAIIDTRPSCAAAGSPAARAGTLPAAGGVRIEQLRQPRGHHAGDTSPVRRSPCPGCRSGWGW
jgi:hypothetical protein